MFGDPNWLRPHATTAQVTEVAATACATLATNLRAFGTPEKIASRFLMRVLFAAMAMGCSFGADDIAYFDGGLFNATETAVPNLTAGDIGNLSWAATLDWASIEPAIFGTLFERSLDPGKRSELGAHYTSRDDEQDVVGSVLMQPLRRRWENLLADRSSGCSDRPGPQEGPG